MELKRRYRVSPLISPTKHRIQNWMALKHAKKDVCGFEYEVRKNSWFRSRLFSLTALYWLLSTYGESVFKPAVIGIGIFTLSMILWLTQSDPTLQPNFDFRASRPSLESNYIGLDQILNGTQWRTSLERSLADFLPILSIGDNTKLGMFDYVIKVVSGVLVFGLLAIAL